MLILSLKTNNPHIVTLISIAPSSFVAIPRTVPIIYALFKRQIAKGGPVTVTDPNIIRYFMTIPEAAQWVIQAGTMGKGGDVFVLDMGEPVKIAELAAKLIKLSGLEVKDELNPNGDVEIQFTGLRPGEKLYEELLIGDNVGQTRHERIMTADEIYLP